MFVSEMSRPTLDTTQHPTQWAACMLCPGYSDRSVKLSTHHHLVQKLWMHPAFPPPPPPHVSLHSTWSLRPLAQGIHRRSHGTEAEFCCACSICVTHSTHLLRHAGCYFLQGIKFLTPKQDGFERDFSPGTHSVTWTVTLVLSHGPALTCGNRTPGGDVTKWRRYAS